VKTPLDVTAMPYVMTGGLGVKPVMIAAEAGSSATSRS
jgi:hypothetical protein